MVGERSETPAVNRTLEQVAAYAGGNDGAGGPARSLARLDKQGFTALLGYAAKQEGSFIGDLSKVADVRRVVGRGQESVVHPSREPGYVIKVNNFKLIDAEHSPLDFFDGIKAYNEFMPSLRLDVLGFTENDAGDVFAVMRQKHIPASRHATQAEITKYFEERGFSVGRDAENGGRIAYRSADYTILDAEPRNVFVGKDGELYPIDLIVQRTDGGTAAFSGPRLEMPMSDAVRGELREAVRRAYGNVTENENGRYEAREKTGRKMSRREFTTKESAERFIARKEADAEFHETRGSRDPEKVAENARGETRPRGETAGAALSSAAS